MVVNLCATVVGFLTVFKLALLSIHHLVEQKLNEWWFFYFLLLFFPLSYGCL